MKLATIVTEGGTAVARVDGDRAVVLRDFADVGEVLAAGALESVAAASGSEVATDSLVYAPLVLAPSKIVCVGLNYRAHILEMKRDLPEYPVLFAKFADTLAAAGETLVLPPESGEIDWEGELAVVIGATVRRADETTARSAIAGYTIANDVSMRDWQFRTREWLQGKLWDRSTPLGPVLATPEEIPADAQLTTELDGEVMQRGDIHDLVHDPVSLVQYISTITTLRPGDIVLTGTPGGVGHARTPQRYLAPGNSVTITVDGIGSLTNDFAAEERG
ncbi:MAG TPA: 2-hydroxyhepta-2,4-diene-1,7-dioate isomerase [Microbacterium sp.]|uniref:fumarylacetoacetate hydrolase family protein n=1 Tax=unclassified Microbacterium TaxID=2609290 RepID=UPI000C53384F|nr:MULTISPECIES: fumarylacetoacetate hydrolase family protein [unclassified Microbacterium]MBU19956.1 2-hydroxyhepta-2,4-diene-1,7-dioate isomerase [Microbacterium sp.]HBS09484.1 2-hydroxyhepta-2,4-diene-1,7-dioate isomerase [Microbacterium sp.]HBU42229.1 2-hydroxyhepta-2,4-diene-1,7-dioate isomerase [Microbacterium sp.]|tara:strand:+ start:3612 stop:4439 length:828 start_codon:yes stop_codon:yes gene_type:complete